MASHDYTATYTATMPRHWPKGHTNLGIVLDLPDGSQTIACSYGYEVVPGQTITLHCPIELPHAGPAVFHFGVDVEFQGLIAASDTNPAPAEATDRHTVVAP